MNVPDHLRYTSDHEWVLIEGDTATVGVTDHAQEELTDVVFVELPEVGRSVAAGDPVGVVESVKAASDVYAPVAGEVVAANEAVVDDPSLVNSDPYGQGWLFRIRLADAAAPGGLMDAEAYRRPHWLNACRGPPMISSVVHLGPSPAEQERDACLSRLSIDRPIDRGGGSGGDSAGCAGWSCRIR